MSEPSDSHSPKDGDLAQIRFKKAQPGWEPLHLAKFRFIARSGSADWKLAFSEYILQACAEAIVTEVEDEVRAQLGRYRLAICGNEGKFRLDDMNPNDPQDRFWYFMPVGFPSGFFKQVLDTEDCRVDADPAVSLAWRVHHFINHSFDDAIQSERLSVYARSKTIWGDFVEIYPDQWRVLEKRTTGDSRYGDGTVCLIGPDQTIFYHPHAVPADEALNQPIPVTNKLDHKQRARAFTDKLVELMKKHPHGPTMPKTLAWAKKNWRLSERETRHCIEEAKNITKSKWYEGGRPEKNSHRLRLESVV